MQRRGSPAFRCAFSRQLQLQIRSYDHIPRCLGRSRSPARRKCFTLSYSKLQSSPRTHAEIGWLANRNCGSVFPPRAGGWPAYHSPAQGGRRNAAGGLYRKRGRRQRLRMHLCFSFICPLPSAPTLRYLSLIEPPPFPPYHLTVTSNIRPSCYDGSVKSSRPSSLLKRKPGSIPWYRLINSARRTFR